MSVSIITDMWPYKDVVDDLAIHTAGGETVSGVLATMSFLLIAPS